MRDTVRIMGQLMMKGNLNDRDDSELFSLASDEAVQQELEIFSEEWGFYLLRTVHDLYLIPLPENQMFSARLRELREHTASNARNLDAYLQCYILMVILWMFFGSRRSRAQQESALRIRDIVEKLDERFASEEHQEDMENVQINFHKIAEKWKGSILMDEGRKNKIEQVRTACRFLEKNKLVEFWDDGDEIRPKQRLIDLMTGYYLNDTRIDEIHAIFEKEEYHAGI
ncbi:MAG: hypothetical protein J5979_07970 [Lachnospiraceae bacterium]|nr:hypothetical protein [Lachnospiraceae bacterium]